MVREEAPRHTLWDWNVRKNVPQLLPRATSHPVSPFQPRPHRGRSAVLLPCLTPTVHLALHGRIWSPCCCYSSKLVSSTCFRSHPPLLGILQPLETKPGTGSSPASFLGLSCLLQLKMSMVLFLLPTPSFNKQFIWQIKGSSRQTFTTEFSGR